MTASDPRLLSEDELRRELEHARTSTYGRREVALTVIEGHVAALTEQSQAERESARQKLADAEMEFRRGLVALRLEVPDAVWGDINLRFAAFVEAAWDAHNRAAASSGEGMGEPWFPQAKPAGEGKPNA